ncbi:hypothetical protein DUI87_30182 [Hirundo rustica rustica]|uniref:Uncharacterized protein n=1 Tax=Hirundo rustica rustica TaxID=333673 RepID=A0A3M0IY09_HIRRU|nr:hypothetical protein DUI87_30182 [Hirundo rustica rustica]
MKDKGKAVLPLSVAGASCRLPKRPAKAAGLAGKAATESRNVQGCCWRLLQTLGYPGKERWEKADLSEEEGRTKDLDFQPLKSPGDCFLPKLAKEHMELSEYNLRHEQPRQEWLELSAGGQVEMMFSEMDAKTAGKIPREMKMDRLHVIWIWKQTGREFEANITSWRAVEKKYTDCIPDFDRNLKKPRNSCGSRK